MSDFAAGHETLDAALFDVADIPWDDLAFATNRYALEKYVEDAGQDNGIHVHVIRKRRPA